MATIVSNSGAIIINGSKSFPREKLSAKIRFDAVEITAFNGEKVRVKVGTTVDGATPATLELLLTAVSELTIGPAQPEVEPAQPEE